MNLFPFTVPGLKDSTIIKKREIDQVAATKYREKLAEYRETLESYKKFIEEHNKKQYYSSKSSLEHNVTYVQLSLDLTYIKEQGDRILEQLEDMKNQQNNYILIQIENLMAAIVETNLKLEALDNKNMVGHLTEILMELQKQSLYQLRQVETGLWNRMDHLEKSIKGSKRLLWFLIILNFIGIGGLTFTILYILDVISFGYM